MPPAVYHGVGARANEDPTEYFLTCLHLLVNVGMALRDLVGSFKVAATAVDTPPASKLYTEPSTQWARRLSQRMARRPRRPARRPEARPPSCSSSTA